jgi:hypothetical protein
MPIRRSAVLLSVLVLALASAPVAVGATTTPRPAAGTSKGTAGPLESRFGGRGYGGGSGIFGGRRPARPYGGSRYGGRGYQRPRRNHGFLRGLFHGLFWGWLLSHLFGYGFGLGIPFWPILLVIVVLLFRRRGRRDRYREPLTR